MRQVHVVGVLDKLAGSSIIFIVNLPTAGMWGEFIVSFQGSCEIFAIILP